MEVDYTLLQSKDVYYITNNDPTTIYYRVEEIDPCTANNTLVEGVLPTTQTLTIPLITDGNYRIRLFETVDGEYDYLIPDDLLEAGMVVILKEDIALFVPNLVTPGPDVPGNSTIYIPYFLNLQLSMIENIFSVLCPCDCGCANCVDLSSKQCEALITTRNKIDVFKYVNSPYYNQVFVTVHQNTACLIEPPLYCDIATEGLTGMASYNYKLTKQLIALDYLAMYFWDLKVATLSEYAYINTKYQSESILCCVNKLGVDIKEISQIITDMAAGTITSAAYVNLGPIDVGFLNIDVVNRVVNSPFTMTDFTENVTVYPPGANNPNPIAANNVFFAVRIESILAGAPEGMLKYLGVNVVIGDIIEFSDIVNLTYTSPDVDVADVDTFTYSISNVGAPTTFVS
jgi:hypothetical protein